VFEIAKRKAKKKVVQKQTNILPKDLFLEIRNNHLEMDKLKLELQNIGLQIENHERMKTLGTLRRSDVKNAILKLQREHEAFLDEVKRKTGIDIKGKTINPNTLEVS